jgi:ACS family glucarate transporter-like MFS transporter
MEYSGMNHPTTPLLNIVLQHDNAQKRWKFAFLMGSGVAVTYLDRVNISHAILSISRDLHFNPTQQGLVLSAFSWGYACLMIIGGILVDRIGPIKAVSLAAVIWSAATAFTGVSVGLYTMIICRIIVGVGEAPLFPANARLVREHFPLQERARATAIFDVGAYIGAALAAPLIVFLIQHVSWRYTFIACALLSFAWASLWRYQTRNIAPPVQLSHFSEHILTRNLFVLLLINRNVLAASAGFFCYNYTKSFFLTWLPTYLIKECGFTFSSIAYIGIIPPITAIPSELFAAFVTDWFLKRGMNVTMARKLPLCIGLMLASICLFSVSVVSHWPALFLLSLAFGFNIAASPGIWSIPGDIAPHPNTVATIGGIQNCFSNIAGIIAPVINGAIFTVTGSLRPALVLSAIMSLLGALIYGVIMGNLLPIGRVTQDA